MRIRLDVAVPDVADRHAVVEVPDHTGYALCRDGRATQLPRFRPITHELTAEQAERLQAELFKRDHGPTQADVRPGRTRR